MMGRPVQQPHSHSQPIPDNRRPQRPGQLPVNAGNVKQLPVDMFPGYEVDIKPLEVQEMLVSKGLINPSVLNQQGGQILLPNLREHVREHVRQHIQKIRDQKQPTQPQPVNGKQSPHHHQHHQSSHPHHGAPQHPNHVQQQGKVQIRGQAMNQAHPFVQSPSVHQHVHNHHQKQHNQAHKVAHSSVPNPPPANPVVSEQGHNGQRLNAITYHQPHGSESYVRSPDQSPSHYGIQPPSGAKASHHPNRGDLKRPMSQPTNEKGISKNGFVPIQPGGSQLNQAFSGDNQWPAGSKMAGNKPLMQASGSSHEYQYYSQPINVPSQDQLINKLSNKPTTSKPTTTVFVASSTTAKKPQLLIIPVPDSHPQAQTFEDMEKLAQMYPNLFPHGLDFKRITTAKPGPIASQFSSGQANSNNNKEEFVYVVVDDKKANSLKNMGIDLSKGGAVSMNDLMKNPEILSVLASQQGFHFNGVNSKQNVNNVNKLMPGHHQNNNQQQHQPPRVHPVHFVKHDDKQTNEANPLIKGKKDAVRKSSTNKNSASSP